MGITSARGDAVRGFAHPVARWAGPSACSVGILLRLLHLLPPRTSSIRHSVRHPAGQQRRRRLPTIPQRLDTSSEACDPVLRTAAVVGGKLVGKPV